LDQTFLKSSKALCGNTCDRCSKREQSERCITFDIQNS